MPLRVEHLQHLGWQLAPRSAISPNGHRRVQPAVQIAAALVLSGEGLEGVQ